MCIDTVVSIFNFLISTMLNISSCIHLPSVYPLWWNFSSCVLPIFWLHCLFTAEFWEFFIYSRYKYFVRYTFCTYFFSICSLCVHFPTWTLTDQVFSFDEVQTISFSFYALSFWCQLRILRILCLAVFIFCFSPKFHSLTFTFRSIIHSE